MWEELGIVPTADPKAIRRAYAGRLRGLDPDQDPAGFQRLRQAFEAALSQAEQPARAAPQRARELRGPPPPPPPHNPQKQNRRYRSSLLPIAARVKETDRR
jgi:hypothetical protein